MQFWDTASLSLMRQLLHPLDAAYRMRGTDQHTNKTLLRTLKQQYMQRTEPILYTKTHNPYPCHMYMLLDCVCVYLVVDTGLGKQCLGHIS